MATPTTTARQNIGAAYVFVREGGSWKQQAYLKPSDLAAADYFGAALALDGDTLIAAALHESPIAEFGTTRPGAAYVFTRANGVWSQTQRLAASQPNAADLFGVSIGKSGDTLAIGASFDATNGDRSGVVYIFGWDGSKWIERQKIQSSQPSARALFG
jgi:FG-GAP repeat